MYPAQTSLYLMRLHGSLTRTSLSRHFVHDRPSRRSRDARSTFRPRITFLWFVAV